LIRRRYLLFIVAACLVVLAGPVGPATVKRAPPQAAPAPGPAARARPVDVRQPAPTDWVASEHDLTVGGRVRSYRLVRPTAPVAGASLPLLVVLHGRTMTPAATEEQTGFPSVVGRAIIAYPAGFGASWNAGACCGEAHTEGVDDVGFVTAMVHQVLTTESDASGVVFLVGYSNGGRLAYRLACEAPGVFTAVAMVEAAPVMNCAKVPSTPLMIVAATDDPFVHIKDTDPPITTDGFQQPSLTKLATTWAEAESCARPTVHRPSPELTITAWAGCTLSSRVALSLYAHGDHAWPAGDGRTASAQRLVWRFFVPHPTTSAETYPF
jgi:polyhydroxybutyrate depolymerase